MLQLLQVVAELGLPVLVRLIPNVESGHRICLIPSLFQVD